MNHISRSRDFRLQQTLTLVKLSLRKCNARRVAQPIVFFRTYEGAPSKLCLGGPVSSQTEKAVITD
jgi:hypothetical protein